MRRPIVEGHVESSRCGRVLYSLVLALLLLPRTAHAQAAATCTNTEQRWLAMQPPPVDPTPAVAFADIVKHVGSELLLRQIELCTSRKATRPLGELRLEAAPPTSLRISLWASDPQERLGERSLDLDPIPSDARLLAIAVAADELVAANLRELERRATLASQRQRAAAAPARVPTPPPARARWYIGPGFVYESFDAGQGLLGVDARWGARLAGPLWATLRAGFRQGLPKQVDHGGLHATALVGGAGLSLELLASERLRLDLLARLDAMRLHASAYPVAGATAHDEVGVAVLLGGGPGLRIALSRSVSLLVEGAAGGALRPVHLTDSGKRVSGVSGLMLGGGGGVLVAF